MILEIDSRDFDAGGRAFVSSLATEADVVLRDYAGDVAVESALATPPGSFDVQGTSALERGEKAVTANTLRVVQPVTGATGTRPVAQVVRENWRGGRTVRRGRKVIVSRADFESYLEKTFPKVGYTAGGFEAAAAALGKSLPGWIEDRNGPGSVSIVSNADGIEIEFTNEVPWLEDLNMGSRMAAIMEKGEPVVLSRLSEVMERAAAVSGF